MDSKKFDIINITYKQLDHYIFNYSEEKMILIDLRTSEEFQTSHIKHAINIPISEKNIDDYYNMLKDMHILIVMYCDRGSSSLYLALKLLNYNICIKSLIDGFDGYKGKYIV